MSYISRNIFFLSTYIGRRNAFIWFECNYNIELLREIKDLIFNIQISLKYYYHYRKIFKPLNLKPFKIFYI